MIKLPSKNGIEIVKYDYMNNGRFGYRFAPNLSNFEAYNYLKISEIRDAEIFEKTKEANHIKNHSEFPSRTHPVFGTLGYDCRDYVFDEINIPKFTSRESRGPLHVLFDEDLPELKWLPFPEKGSIASYTLHTLDKSLGFSHWGIVTSVTEEIIVTSKWGEKGDLYTHSLEKVPKPYGNVVTFFKKNKKN